MRHDDGRPYAGKRRRVRDTLAVISSCRGDNPGRRMLRAAESIDIKDSAAQLECAYRTVILVLHPDLGARTLAKQRPPDLRSRRENRVDDSRGLGKIFTPGKFHCFSRRSGALRLQVQPAAACLGGALCSPTEAPWLSGLRKRMINSLRRMYAVSS